MTAEQDRAVLPFGAWPSPLSPASVANGSVKLVDVWVDPSTRLPNGAPATVWQEARPAEGGRQPLVVTGVDGRPRDLFPAPFSARSAVHEYGGGAAWVADGTAWFVNSDDQRIWRVSVDGSDEPVALTAEPDRPRSVRYADLRSSPDGRWLVAVRERHHGGSGGSGESSESGEGGEGRVDNDIVVVAADRPSRPVVVYAGSDFVMSPRFVGSDEIRFIAWDHPDMPWTVTALMRCRFDSDTATVGETVVVTTGCSLMQPVGDLVIADRSGWWNLWRVSDGTAEHLWPSESEIGGPPWVFGLRDVAEAADGRVVWSASGSLVVDGVVHDSGDVALEQLAVADGTVTAIARPADRPAEIVRFDLDSPHRRDVVVPAAPAGVRPGDVSRPEHIEFPTSGTTAHAWFYPPTNSSVQGPDGAAPPLVTMIHGGPTGAARRWYTPIVQFWTTRGFAVVDVDHRGSTGYGTAYRRLLDGNWGVVDVEDCIAAARTVAAAGLVDAGRMVIRGSSAGGFTALACLASSDVFAAGSCSYGIADLSVLATDTHKFESRYTDRLIGRWPVDRHLYDERSPIRSLDRVDAPVIVFQGTDDAVVPMAQSEMIVDALRRRGIECEYHLYPGEGHGFRRAATIEHQLGSELAFYRRVLGLAPITADPTDGPAGPR